MADHFARAAGFAAGGGDETTEASMMPPPRNAAANRFDSTMDTDTNAFTGIVAQPILRTASSSSSAARDENGRDRRVSNGKQPAAMTGSIRVPPSRVPLAPSSAQTSSPSGSRPSSRPSSSNAAARGALSAPYEVTLDDDEGDSSDEIAERPNLTNANETTVASADASEWERHIKESKNKAGVSSKQMQDRIDSLLQERDDLKIEVDSLRRHYNPSEEAAEIIRLRQENTRVLQHRLTLTNLVTAQKKTIKDLNKQVKTQSSSQQGSTDRETRRRMDEMEEGLRLLDQQKDEEAQARQQAEDELERLREQLLRSDNERNDLQADKEDLDQEIYRLEKQRDEAEEKREALDKELRHWQESCREHEDRVAELEEHAQNRANQSAATRDLHERHRSELDRLEAELEQRIEDHQKTQQELQEVRGQLEASAAEVAVFRGEVDAQRSADENKYDRLRDELAAKSNELMQLEEEFESAHEARKQIEEELEELLQARKQDEVELADLGARFEDLARQLEEKEAEVLECNKEIAQQSEAIRRLEDEQDLSIADAEEAEHFRAEAESELESQREHYEMKLEQLKQRLADAAAEMAETGERLRMSEEDGETLREKLQTYRETLKQRNSELEAAQDHTAKLEEKCQDMLADLQDEERRNESLAAEWEKRMADNEDDLRRIIEEKEDALAAAEDDLAHARRSLRDRDADLEALQKVLQAKEDESEKMGRSSATDKHSLKLEVDRLKRDLERCEQDLERARDEVDRKDEALRERASQVNKLYSESAEAQAKLATETQTRLGLDERIAALKTSLQESERALADARGRADTLEKKSHDDELSIDRAESAVRKQVLERNSLLQAISQHMIQILGGVDDARKRSNEPRPSSDFGAFHALLLGRVRKLVEIKSMFERRASRIEAQATDSVGNLRRQQESRFKQIDRIEGALKGAQDKQSAWRSRLVTKQSELDATKNTVAELQSQISSLKTRNSLSTSSENTKLTTLNSRANTAEKRLRDAQQAASQADERLAEAKAKYNQGESKWLARIKELEARCKAAEEKVKRERQGAKERVAEQQEQRRKLEADVEAAQRRLRTVDHLREGLEGVD